MALERISVSLDEHLVEQFEQFITARGYKNRSEAVRDLIREKMEHDRVEHASAGYCVGTLSYIYNHEERTLASRLMNEHHAHHDVVVSTTHIHLDHDNCLETVMLKGDVARIRAFADSMMAMPGVRHGALNMVLTEQDSHAHSHSHDGDSHHHLTPIT